MGKKFSGANEKRKSDAKASKAAGEANAKEEATWAAHANPVNKRDVKREEQERKAADAAARKAEARRLLAEEEAALSRKKEAVPKVGKVTAHQLHLLKEAERKEAEKAEVERRLSATREVAADTHAAAMDVEIRNLEDGGVEASGVDAALAALSVDALSVDADVPADRHPEKRAKAAWEAYYARRLEEMKADKPGLRLMQYKSKIFDEWQRSPLNPRNQAPKE